MGACPACCAAAGCQLPAARPPLYSLRRSAHTRNTPSRASQRNGAPRAERQPANVCRGQLSLCLADCTDPRRCAVTDRGGCASRECAARGMAPAAARRRLGAVGGQRRGGGRLRDFSNCCRLQPPMPPSLQTPASFPSIPIRLQVHKRCGLGAAGVPPTLGVPPPGAAVTNGTRPAASCCWPIQTTSALQHSTSYGEG